MYQGNLREKLEDLTWSDIQDLASIGVTWVKMWGDVGRQTRRDLQKGRHFHQARLKIHNEVLTAKTL
jgi:hypothetical protein